MKRILSLFFAVAAAGCGAALLGCNGSSADGVPGGPGDFFITPDGATLGLGETVASFNVHGGDEPMTWAVGDPGLGAVTDTTGRIANYTRNGNTEGANEITVTDAKGLRAPALVIQRGDVPGLSIRPDRATLTASNQVVTLRANGGDAPYAWAVIDPSLGTLSNTDQSAVNYARNGAAEGQNIVELTDANGTLATAVIVQPPVPPP